MQLQFSLYLLLFLTRYVLLVVVSVAAVVGVVVHNHETGTFRVTMHSQATLGHTNTVCPKFFNLLGKGLALLGPIENTETPGKAKHLKFLSFFVRGCVLATLLLSS